MHHGVMTEFIYQDQLHSSRFVSKQFRRVLVQTYGSGRKFTVVSSQSSLSLPLNRAMVGDSQCGEQL